MNYNTDYKTFTKKELKEEAKAIREMRRDGLGTNKDRIDLKKIKMELNNRAQG